MSFLYLPSWNFRSFKFVVVMSRRYQQKRRNLHVFENLQKTFSFEWNFSPFFMYNITNINSSPPPRHDVVTVELDQCCSAQSVIFRLVKVRQTVLEIFVMSCVSKVRKYMACTRKKRRYLFHLNGSFGLQNDQEKNMGRFLCTM